MLNLSLLDLSLLLNLSLLFLDLEVLIDQVALGDVDACIVDEVLDVVVMTTKIALLAF